MIRKRLRPSPRPRLRHSPQTNLLPLRLLSQQRSRQRNPSRSHRPRQCRLRSRLPHRRRGRRSLQPLSRPACPRLRRWNRLRSRRRHRLQRPSLRRRRRRPPNLHRRRCRLLRRRNRWPNRPRRLLSNPDLFHRQPRRHPRRCPLSPPPSLRWPRRRSQWPNRRRRPRRALLKLLPSRCLHPQRNRPKRPRRLRQ